MYLPHSLLAPGFSKMPVIPAQAALAPDINNIVLPISVPDGGFVGGMYLPVAGIPA
jgi:hypothetical protein